MARPNILLVITHDSGRHFGCYGAEVETPNVDRLAREGVLFERAFCTAPQCSPARGSLLTGLYPHRNGLIGLTHRGFRMNESAKRLPARLADAGYHTLLFGVHHEEPDAHLMGYRRVLAEDDRSIRGVLPEVEGFLSSQPPQPFFACVGFSETHRPYDPARHPMDDPDDVIVPAWLPDEPAVRADVAQLNGCIRGVDEAIGRIESALAAAGLTDKTLVIYTTDHGVSFPGAKGTLLEPGIGVALAARGPGQWRGGKKISRLVGTMDLTPTLLEVAGVAPPEGLDGRSLLPLLEFVVSPSGDDRRLTASLPTPWRDHLFVEQTFHAAYDPMRGVRTETHKYIRSFADRPIMFAPNVDESPTKALMVSRGLHRQPRPAEMLFDLRTDPDERLNLADEPGSAELLTQLRQRVAGWMAETGDPLAIGQVAQPSGTRVTPAGSMKPEEMDGPSTWR